MVAVLLVLIRIYLMLPSEPLADKSMLRPSGSFNFGEIFTKLLLYHVIAVPLSAPDPDICWKVSMTGCCYLAEGGQNLFPCCLHSCKSDLNVTNRLNSFSENK